VRVAPVRARRAGQNIRVPAPLSPSRARRVTTAAVLTAAALALTGCAGSASDDTSEASTSPSESSSTASPSPSSTVSVPASVTLTDQGSSLPFGKAAAVIFESTQNKGTVLQLTLHGVQKGRLSDFRNFILDDPYKQQANYYYAKVSVKNIGDGDVGGVAVPLWGVNAANTLLPAVSFETPFPTCPSRRLPASFPPGATLDTCLVYLSPDHGSLESVSYRPSQEFDPIVWKGTIEPPAKEPAKKGKGKKKKR
jgi:hypothetical protein